MIALNSTTVVLWVSLTTLQVHWCSYYIYRRAVTDNIYPRNIASKADIYLGILLRVRKFAVLQDIQRRCEAEYVPQYWQSNQTDKI
jgi:hypothetical protein